MARTYLLLGSNLGNSRETLIKAIALLEVEAGKLHAVSAVYRTEPWGGVSGGDFYNCVAEFETTLSPQALLDLLLRTEKQLGRVRTQETPEPRTIDIDILFYGNEVMDEPELQIPHPRLHLRRFTLAPMADIAPGHIHPVFNKSVKQLLDECADSSFIHKLTDSNTI